MRFYRERRAAMVTVELVISLVLITVVLLLTLGLFSDNLKTMFTASNFSNIFKGGNTVYSLFHRDYSTPNSSVDIQLLAEQGLGKIRQIANNSAVGIIDKARQNGDENNQQDGNTLWYLREIINAIVGDPTICTKMKFDSKAKCEEILNTSNYALIYKTGKYLSVQSAPNSAGGDTTFNIKISNDGQYATGQMDYKGSASIPGVRTYTKANLGYIDTSIAALVAGVLDDTDKMIGNAVVSPADTDIYDLMGENRLLNDGDADNCVLYGKCHGAIGAIEKALAQNWVEDRGKGPCACVDLSDLDKACYPAVTQERNMPGLCHSGSSFWDIIKSLPDSARQNLNKDNFRSYEYAKIAYYKTWSNQSNQPNQPLDISKAVIKGNSIIAQNNITNKYENLLLPTAPSTEDVAKIITNYNKIYSLWYNDKLLYSKKHGNGGHNNSQNFKNINNNDLGHFCYKYAQDSCFVYYIRQDQKFNSCKIFQNGLIKIAKAHGFDNLANDIAQDRQCEPYNTSSSNDWKPRH